MFKSKSNKKARKLYGLFYQNIQKAQAPTQQQVNWLLRTQFVLGHRLKPQAGFVLPTVTMSLLVLSLVVGSILIRTTDRAVEAIRVRENSLVYNSATPAIDRAKAKLEYLFQSDARFPTSVPSENVLYAMMSNIPNLDSDGDTVLDSIDIDGDSAADVAVLNPDIYTLPDEQRVDINDDGTLDNAWSYTTDLDGDGTSETVTYSVLMNTELDVNGDGNISQADNDISIGFSSDTDKATNLVTRSGPLSISGDSTSASCTITTGSIEQGWFPINSATVRKNFQINTVVANDKEPNRSVTALEFQQDRQLDKGNKFGAWFRYDLLLHPGPDFNWNGAMHTDGNLYVYNQNMDLHLVSSPNSCIYSEDASQITLNQIIDDSNNTLFQGQAIFDTTNDGNDMDIIVGGNRVTEDLKASVDSRKDNLKDGSSDPGRWDYSVNALRLFTQGIIRSRYTSDTSNVFARADDWKTADETKDIAKRIINQRQTPPYIDDTYRADDRWGPKPSYGRNAIDQLDATTNVIGTDIPSSRTDLRLLDPPATAEDAVGLDGYWERRANFNGLRVIVGQRLELGNTFGWEGYQVGNTDPLYPVDLSTYSPPVSNRGNEFLQQRTWRDNLAAVQSTAVYHHTQDSPTNPFPVACLATTAHAGTDDTLAASRTFTQDSLDLTDDGVDNPTATIVTNFFEGEGTNGWEFNPPAASESAFETAINNESGALHLALTNLGNFAGDPYGAFPAKQYKATSPATFNSPFNVIHPYPHLTMWGDFSNLRRIMEKLDDTSPDIIDYDDLSLADKTTLQTASCTLGMLSHNISVAKAIYDQTITPLETDAKSEVDMGNAVTKAITGTGNKEIYKFIENQDIIDDGYADNDDLISSGNGTDLVRTPEQYVSAKYGVTTPTNAQLVEYYSLFTPEQYIEAYEDAPGGGTADIAAVRAYAEEVTGVNGGHAQFERDRAMGFQPGLPPSNLAGGSGWDPTTGQSSNSDYHLDSSDGGVVPLKTGCDPDIFDPIVVGSGGGLIAKKVGLALAFCDRFATMAGEPKYPSLYYIFPVTAHEHDGTGAVAQPATEEYIADSHISNIVNPHISGNDLATDSDDLYQVVNPSDIAIRPKALANWVLPVATTGDDVIDNEITIPDGTKRYVSILDRIIQNGRQLMAVRTLTLDLGLLTGNLNGRTLVTSGTSTIGGESWIPDSGLVYTFREDALREDAIARPEGDTWTNCSFDTGNEAKLTKDSGGRDACQMDASSSSPNDPPVNDSTGVSPKPVDEFPDPARRPYGFRLINGAKLGRTTTDRGMSLISDQPIYIQGDFNEHKDSSGNVLEEFTEKLASDWSNFYTRSTLDTNFAKPSTDSWRPTEILSDAITVLSDNFCDGTIESGILWDDSVTNCDGTDQQSSFLNSLINKDHSVGDSEWIREDPGNSNSPIRVTRNALLRFDNGTEATFTNYQNRNYNRTGNGYIDDAQATTINTVFVSGITSRLSYGGLHNFPRFLEDWGGVDLNIAGSFVQLNFSTYDTANYNLGDWEPGTDSNGSHNYYSPPNRRWGYDVALLYNPPGPIADRLFSTSARRSEFYKELSADDPYIQALLCAEDSSGDQIYTNESCP